MNVSQLLFLTINQKGISDGRETCKCHVRNICFAFTRSNLPLSKPRISPLTHPTSPLYFNICYASLCIQILREYQNRRRDSEKRPRIEERRYTRFRVQSTILPFLQFPRLKWCELETSQIFWICDYWPKWSVCATLPSWNYYLEAPSHILASPKSPQISKF